MNYAPDETPIEVFSTNEHEREHGVTYASAGIQRHAEGIRHH